MRTLFATLLCLTACSTPDDAREQADLVIAVYERDYADVSDADVKCVHDVRVRYARLGHTNVERCGTNNVGCTIVGPRNVRIWIGNDLEEQVEHWSLRHEYTHALLWCVTGDSHENHDVPEFGFRAEVDAPGSLSALADELEGP